MALGVFDKDDESVGDAVGVAVGVSELVEVPEGDWVTVRGPVTVGVTETGIVGVWDTDAPRERVAVCDGVGVVDTELVEVGDKEIDAVGDGVGVGVMTDVRVPETVAVWVGVFDGDPP